MLYSNFLGIEAATVADAADILALQRLAYQSEAELYDDFSIPPLTQTLEELVAEFPGRRVLKLMSRGRIIGAVQGFTVGNTCFIGRLMVHPTEQGKGHGTRLMAAIEASFSTVERFELFTGHNSSANLRLYKRLGYMPFRTEEINPRLSLVFMEKYQTL